MMNSTSLEGDEPAPEGDYVDVETTESQQQLELVGDEVEVVSEVILMFIV